MSKKFVAILLGAFIVAPCAHSGETYDDREVLKRTLDLAVALYKAIPSARQCDTEVAKFRKDPVKGQVAELQAIARKLRAASKSEGPEEIRQARVGIAQKTAALTQAVSTYGASAASYAAIKAQIATHKKTEPKC